MCGIIAITTRRKTNVSKMISSGLKRLEYRGYDSVGIATISEGKIQTMKEEILPSLTAEGGYILGSAAGLSFNTPLASFRALYS